MQKKNILAVVACYTIWGLLPLYWNLLSNVASSIVFSSRLIFGGFFCVLLCALMRRFAPVRALLRDKRAMKHLLVATPLICLNWGIFIWAVHAGRTLDASLGYYLNPLVVFVLSIVFFKEKCGRLELCALAIAAAGVLLSVILFGSFPIAAVLLAFSFAFYGAVKKKAHVDAIASTTVEMLLATPFFILYLLLFQAGNIAALTLREYLLLFFGGAFTAVPLILYALGVNGLPFITVGFAQYISPTLMIFCSLLMGETLGVDRLVPLCIILVALAVYSVGMIKKHKMHAGPAAAAKKAGA